MNESTTGATPVERAFQEFLERQRRGQSVDRESFVREQPESVQAGLVQMLADYDALRGQPAGGVLRAGAILGDFRLVGELGRGGMGVVWEAEQLSMRRRVALKLLPPLAFSPRLAELFQREAAAGGRLAHPGIVQTHAFGEADGLQYIVQELVPGGMTLADLLARARQDPETSVPDYRSTAELFTKVAEALHYAHAAGVVHRDIKPSNILITPDGQPKVTDFGLARVEGQLGLSRTGDLAGTPHYMSPEQALSKRIGIDHRTDVFSLGATLYEALTLNKAFDGDTSQQIIARITLEDPPEPVSVRSRVPRDLSVICMKALEKGRERRYATMADLAADLQRFLRHQPIVARPPGPAARCWKWARRHPIVSASGAVAVAALVVVSALFLRLQAKHREVERARTDAVRHGYIASLSAATLSVESGLVDEGRRLLNACAPEHRGWEWRHLRLAADPAVQTLLGHDAEIVDLQFSPDGARLASAARDLSVRVWWLEDGRSEVVWDGAGAAPTAVGFAPAADELAIGAADGRAAVIDLGTRRERATCREANDPITTLAYDASGRRLALGFQSSGVLLWDLESERRVWAQGYGRGEPVLRLQFAADGARLAGSGLGFGPVCIWRGTDGALLESWRDPQWWTLGMCWSASELRVAAIRAGSWTGEQDWRLLACPGGDERARWAGWNPRTPYSLRINADGALAAAFDAPRGRLLVWDRAQREPRRIPSARLETHCVALSADGTRVAAAEGATIRIFDRATRGASTPLIPLSWSRDRYQMAAVSADGSWYAALVAGDDSSALHVWEGESGRARAVLRPAAARFESLAFAPADMVAAGRSDGAVELWQTGTWQRKGVLSRGSGAARALGWSRDGVILAVGGADGSLDLFDVQSASHLRRWPAHAGAVRYVAFHPFRDELLTGGDDGVLRSWEARAGAERQRHRSALSAFTGVYALAPSGTEVACATERGIELLSLTGGSLRVANRDGEGGAVLSLSFGSDGRRLAGGCEDGSLRLWDVATGESVCVLRPEAGGAVRALFDPARERLLLQSESRFMVLEAELAAARVLWSEAERQEHADAVVQAARDRLLLLPDILDNLRQDPDLEGELRASAAALAELRGEAPAQVLIARAYRNARLAEASAEERAMARRWAEAALVQRPEDPAVLATLGLALYRSGEAGDALEILERAETLEASAPSSNLAFMRTITAMCWHALGDGAAAARLLDEARVLAEPDPDDEMRRFLGEAAALIEVPPAID